MGPYCGNCGSADLKALDERGRSVAKPGGLRRLLRSTPPPGGSRRDV
jgi:hypothetical protein